MAVAHVADSDVVCTGGSPSSTTVTLTVAGGHSNNCLIATTSWFGTVTVTSMVWDAAGANQAFTSMGTKVDNGSFHAQSFYLVNPTAGASKLVTVTFSSTSPAIGLVAAHFDGVDQATPIRAGTYNSSSSAIRPIDLVITSQANDMTVSGLVTDGFQNNPTTNKTLIGALFNGGVGLAVGADYANGAATVTHSWDEVGTVGSLGVVGGSLAASAGGGGTPINVNTLSIDSLAGGELL